MLLTISLIKAYLHKCRHYSSGRKKPEPETEPAPYLKVLLHPVPPIARIADRPFNIYSLHYILKKSYQFDSWKFIVRHVAVAVVATHEPRPRHKKRKRNEKSVQESEPDARATVVAVVVDGLRRLPGLFFCFFVVASFFGLSKRHLMRRREANQELAQGQQPTTTIFGWRVPVSVRVRVLVNK